MAGSWLGPVLIVIAVVARDAWVARDAIRRQSRGEGVTASVGPVTLDRPEHWLLGCLLLWILVFPMYLVARHQ